MWTVGGATNEVKQQLNVDRSQPFACWLTRCCSRESVRPPLVSEPNCCVSFISEETRWLLISCSFVTFP